MFSGNGLHPYWFIQAAPPELSERVEAALKKLCWALAGDPAVCEVARVMRLPGSHNSKNGAWTPVEVIHKNDVVYELEQLEEWLAGIKEPLLHKSGRPELLKGNGGMPVGTSPLAAAAAAMITPEPIDVDAVWAEMRYHGTEGNGVNLTQWRVIGSLLHEGAPVDESVAYVVAKTWELVPESASWSQKEEINGVRDMCVRTFRNNPEHLGKQLTRPHWLERRLNGAGELQREPDEPGQFAKKPEAQKPPPPVLTTLFLEQLQEREIVPRQWIVDGFILAGQLNGMFGDGGMGKDYLLLQLAIAMTCGGQWLGKDVAQGKVMYFPVEDDLNEVRRREDKITSFLVSKKMYAPRRMELMIVPMVGLNTVLGVYDSKSGIVQPTPVYESVKNLIADFRPALVIVGNRVNIFSVNQNEDAHAVQCLRLLNAFCVEYGTAVLMPGHVSIRGGDTGTGTSGSVQWSNGMRARTFLRRPKDQEDDPNTDKRELQVMKINWGPSDSQINMNWSNGLFVADGITVIKPEPGETDDDARKRQHSELEADIEKEFMNMFNKAVAMGIRMSSQPKATNNPATLFARGEQFTECKYRSDKGFKQLNAAMGRLFMRGKIISRPYGPPSDKTKEVVLNEDNR